MRKTVLILLLLCSVVLAQNPYRVLNSFNSGEISPLLNAREDLAKYQSGCSLMENMIPLPQGGAQKRPGTKYIAEVKTSSLKTRIIPFEFSTTQSYIVEIGNQYARFFTNNAQISNGIGTEDLSSVGSIIAHWLLNDNLATTAVLDDDGGTHDGEMAASVTTSTVHKTGLVGSGCFDFDTQYVVEVTDHNDFSFDDSGVGGKFSITAWIYVTGTSISQHILSKWNDATDREWAFHLSSGGLLKLILADETNNTSCERETDDVLSKGWHFVVATYDSTGGNIAANGITIYVDGSEAASTVINSGTYVRMRNTTTKVTIGAFYSSSVLSNYFEERIDEVAIFSKELSSLEITTLWNFAIYEITTPYLTADLFELKFEQSADVLYITHPDYETRKLLRLANARWELNAISIKNGPVRRQNTIIADTISANVTTGSVTLTAVGHTPFILGTTAGHSPSGIEDTDKSQTGALFRLVHPIATLEYKEELESDFLAGQVEDVSWVDCGILYEGAEWTLVSGDTWFGTIKVQRNYTIGAAVGNGADEGASVGWGTVFTFSSGAGAAVDARNVSTTGTEDDGDAQYRVIYADEIADDTVSVIFSTDQTEHIGIVEITSVTSSTVAIGMVVKTLASTDATHKWSEGSWSNYRGWPATVTFFEDRLIFGGNVSQPDTIWGSVTSDYDNMTAGAEDDEAVIFTLTSRQVNVIEWLIGKDKLLIGTSGAEWTLEGSADEPLTPSNVIAKQHSTYGSANLQAVLANESVLFFQRGKEKMRELAYNWELDSYVAPDMTILANLVTDGGIDDTAFQKIPDSILWCVRNDGEMPVFSYERAENITAWSRMITTDSTSDSDFESVARIHGSPEDEIWVVVKRTINDSTVRYIEQFQPRDFGSDPNDAFYVDCGATYTTDVNVISDLTWLEGESVVALADGVIVTSLTVAANSVTLGAVYQNVQIGLPYTVKMRTMPLSWLGQGVTIHGRIKRISEVVADWYKSGDFSIGKDIDNLEVYSISGQTTSSDRKSFPPGFSREGYVFIWQKSPEPLTILAVAIEFNLR